MSHVSPTYGNLHKHSPIQIIKIKIYYNIKFYIPKVLKLFEPATQRP